MKKLLFTVATFAFLSGTALAEIRPVQVAANSCKSMQQLCAQRCKQRVPDDKNCVSDHCTPKLEECRSTGCWQEGKMYGGKQTCGLAK